MCKHQHRPRLLAAVFDGTMMSYRWCSECCAAMAASWTDNGDAWEARARLGRESTQEKPMCKCKWQSIETAPKDSGYLLLRGGREQDVASGYWLQTAYAGNGAWIWPFVHMTPRFWAPIHPTSAEAVEHG